MRGAELAPQESRGLGIERSEYEKQNASVLVNGFGQDGQFTMKIKCRGRYVRADVIWQDLRGAGISSRWFLLFSKNPAVKKKRKGTTTNAGRRG